MDCALYRLRTIALLLFCVEVLSEKAIVEIFTLCPQDLLIDGFLVSDLRLSLSELNVGRGTVRVLWFVKLLPVLELLLQNCEVWSPRMQRFNVLARDLRLNTRGDKRILSAGLLDRGQVLVP